MFDPSRLCAAALLAASLGGCQALGGGGGVMPETDLGPPPSARGTLPGRPLRSALTDDDGPRRIRREEIDGETTSRSSSGGLAPQMGAGGSVGLGGKF